MAASRCVHAGRSVGRYTGPRGGLEPRRRRVHGSWPPTPHLVAPRASQGRFWGSSLYRLQLPHLEPGTWSCPQWRQVDVQRCAQEGARVFCRSVWSQARIAQRPTGNHLALPGPPREPATRQRERVFAFLGSSWRLRQEGGSLSRLYHALQLVERPDRAPAAWPGAPWILPVAGGGFSGLVVALRHAPVAVVAQSRPGPSLVGGGSVVHWQKPSLSGSSVSRL